MADGKSLGTEPKFRGSLDKAVHFSFGACQCAGHAPGRRVFFRRALLVFLEIHKVFLRKTASPDEKLPRRRIHIQRPDKPLGPTS